MTLSLPCIVGTFLKFPGDAFKFFIFLVKTKSCEDISDTRHVVISNNTIIVPPKKYITLI